MNIRYAFFKSALTVILFELAFSNSIFAQGVISGVVMDDQQIPVPGVSAMIKGSTTGTTTGADGTFSISARSGQTLLFRFMGFESQEVLINGQASLRIVLKPDSKSLNEVIVVGYGTQKKANLTGAVDQVGSEYSEAPCIHSRKA